MATTCGVIPWKCAQGHASKYAGQSWPWPALQRAFGRRRPDRLRPRLQDGARRHRVEEARLALSLRSLTILGQVEKPTASGGEEKRGRLGKMTRRKREIVGFTNERDF